MHSQLKITNINIMNASQNNLLKRYGEISAMRGIRDNRLLNNIEKRTQQPQKINDPSKIREIILDQRKTDTKLDSAKFERIARNLDNAVNTDREKLWASRTNQPYKTIISPKDIKKEYKNKEDLIVYRVNSSDKDEKIFEANTKHFRQEVAQHNKELNDKFSVVHKDQYAKEFEYNHIEKYSVKYDPTEFSDQKETIVDYYKQEQLKQEKDKKCVDDIIETMIAGNAIDNNIVSSSDDENTDGDITNKFGINQLAPEGKFSCEYTIEIK